MSEHRPPNAVAMKARYDGHHVDLGGVMAMAHKSENPYVCIIHRRNHCGRPFSCVDIVLD